MNIQHSGTNNLLVKYFGMLAISDRITPQSTLNIRNWFRSHQILYVSIAFIVFTPLHIVCILRYCHFKFCVAFCRKFYSFDKIATSVWNHSKKSNFLIIVVWNMWWLFSIHWIRNFWIKCITIVDGNRIYCCSVMQTTQNNSIIIW